MGLRLAGRHPVRAYQNGEPDRPLIDRHAKRLAKLGVNLVRLTHVDSDWVHPQLIAPGATTENLDDQAVATLFYWIKALKEQGIYVWVDMITYRPFLKGDNIPGFEEISAHAHNKQRPLAEGYVISIRGSRSCGGRRAGHWLPASTRTPDWR